MRVLPLLLMLALVLPGCAVEDDGNETRTPSNGTGGPDGTGDEPRPPSATLEVAHNGTERSWDVPFDPASRPAASAYTGGFAHPDAFTVHDLLAVWSEQTGESFNVTYSDSYGHSLDAILRTAGWSDADGGWFWRLEVDGTESQTGISGTAVGDCDVVRFVYAPWGDQA